MAVAEEQEVFRLADEAFEMVCSIINFFLYYGVLECLGLVEDL